MTRHKEMFQSLGWVERLSDRTPQAVCVLRKSFNPSDGLSVFQTLSPCAPRLVTVVFQSLGWVERLSDYFGSVGSAFFTGFNPSDGLSVFQTWIGIAVFVHTLRFNPSDGLSVFQTY